MLLFLLAGFSVFVYKHFYSKYLLWELWPNYWQSLGEFKKTEMTFILENPEDIVITDGNLEEATKNRSNLTQKINSKLPELRKKKVRYDRLTEISSTLSKALAFFGSALLFIFSILLFQTLIFTQIQI
jgi:hypothetical protein